MAEDPAECFGYLYVCLPSVVVGRVVITVHIAFLCAGGCVVGVAVFPSLLMVFGLIGHLLVMYSL